MITFLQFFFWINVVLVVYVYFGYPLLILILSRLRPAQSILKADITPSVSLIIAAYNEEQVIAEKLANSLALDYPNEKLEIIVVSDGSKDRTPEIVRDYCGQRVRLVELQDNVGKAYAQNEAVNQVNSDIIFFTDANVSLEKDSLRKLVRHFQDDTVGCVIGKVTYNNESETTIGESEGFYWRYELFIRFQEGKLGNLVAGSGPILALRRTLFEPLDSSISEDFILPMKSAIKGYRNIYEPEAISSERLFQVNPRDMYKTRVRTTTLDTRSVLFCKALLNPFKYPLYAWGLISHKVLRWLVPYFLILILVANLFLIHLPFYQIIFILQIFFYMSALTGYLWQRSGKPPFIFGIPFSFCLVNLAALVGVARFFTGKKSGQWETIR